MSMNNPFTLQLVNKLYMHNPYGYMYGLSLLVWTNQTGSMEYLYRPRGDGH